MLFQIESLEMRRLLTGNPGLLLTVGGTGFDSGNAVVTDSQGNVYVAGPFSETVDFDPKNPGATVITSQHYSLDVFVAKYSPSGDLDWVKTMGGPAFDTVGKMVIDNSGNLYVAGTFDGTATFGQTQLTDAGGGDAFIAKLDSSGNILWADSLGGPGADQGRAVAVDNAGGVYVTGTMAGSGVFEFDGSAAFSEVGVSNTFLVKLDTSGNLQWGEELGGEILTRGRDLAADAEGVYVTGGFDGAAMFDVAGQTGARTSRGTSDGFLAKYSPAGAFDWVRQIGGPGIDRGRSVVIDGDGNVLVSGIFRRHGFFGNGASQVVLKSQGQSDVYVAKYTASGGFLWVQQIGGTANDRARGLAVDSSNDVYVVGGFHNTASLDGGATTLVSRGGFDSFLAEYDTSGSLLLAKGWGGTQDDVANGVTVFGSTIYVTGFFEGTANFNPGSGTDDATSNGQEDIYILGLS